MKIAVDARALQDKTLSGVGRATLWHLEGVHKMFPELELILHARGINRVQLPDSLISLKTEIHRIPNKISNLIITGGCPLPKFFGDSDVVWQPNPMFAPEPVRPTLVTIHDLSPFFWPEFFPTHTRYWYNRWVNKFFTRAHPLVSLATVSQRTKYDIEQVYPEWLGRVHYIPPAVPMVLPKYNSTIDDGLCDDDPYIIVVSTIEPRKNMSAIVAGHRIIKKMIPNLKLYIIGSQQSSLDVSESEGQYILGYVSDSKRDQLIKNAIALVYPSYYEGYGYPAIEAMSLGVPVIVASSGALTETLGNAAIYISPNRCSDELPALILALHDNTEFKEKIVQSGYKRVKYLQESYSPATMVNLWKKLSLD